MGQEESHMASQSESKLVSRSGSINKNNGRSHNTKAKDAKVITQARNMIKTSIARNDARLLDELLSEEIYDISQIDREKWLHKSVKGGQFDIVRILVGYGISANSQDKNGHTPMHIATQLGEKEAPCAIKELKSCGSDINHLGGKSCSKTPLHLAIHKESVVVVNALLQNGCDPDIVSECDKGISPLLLATKGNNEQIVSLLLCNGANLHKCKVWKVTFNPPIDVLTHRLSNQKMDTKRCLSMIKLLLQADCDLLTTLNLMPQGNHSRGTVQGSILSSIKTIVRRLESKSRPHALAFIRLLLYTGYHPHGEEAIAYITTFDPIVPTWLHDIATNPKSLKELSVRAIRRSFQVNALAGVHRLSTPRELKEAILNVGGLDQW